jgi:hypothetical protein
MQELRDIFEIWPSIKDMAADLNEKYDTVKRWRNRSRIPSDVWPRIIEKAARKERLVTAAQLLKFNNVPRRVRRVKEARAS